MQCAARVGPWLAFALGATGLLGWWLDAALLRSVLPGPAMQPNTAVCLLLGALALRLCQARAGCRPARVAAGMLALAVSAVGATTLAEYAIGWNAGLDTLLPVAYDAGPRPGRMSPPTALALLLLGASVLLAELRSGRLSRGLALGSGLVGLIGLLAHVYGAHELYGLGGADVIGMALSTALALVALSLSSVLARPERGITRALVSAGADGILVRRLLAAAVAAPLLFGVLVHLLQLAGLRDVPLALALLATLNTVLGVALVLGTAVRVRSAQARETLRRRWLQSVIDQMPEGVILTDAQGRIAILNRVAAEFATDARSGPDPYGNWLAFDVHRPSGEAFPWDELPLPRALRRREPVSGVELVLRRADAALVPMLVSATPLWTDSAELGGAVVVFQDVSVLKAIERLRQQWTAVMVHELRQPLNVIALSAEALARDGDAQQRPGEAKSLTRIRDASRRLERLIDDLLDASRIEARRLRIERQRLDLAAFLGEAIDRARPALQGHAARLEIRGPLPPVDADPVRIEQVLSNLLLNAAKYGAPGTAIEVRAQAGETEVELAVANRGAGLSSDEIREVFTPFFRTRAAWKSGREGSGLGLYIVRGLVEAHGGQVRAESDPDGETVFRFTLPLAPARAADALRVERRGAERRGAE